MTEWYILYVHTKSENQVMLKLQKKLPSNLYRIFIPYKERFFRKEGILKIEKEICFPGYVFIESKTSANEFRDIAMKYIRNIKEIYSILSRYDKNDIALKESEKQFLEKLLCNCDCIKISYGNFTNGVIHINSGALLGMEKYIMKIVPHKRLAEIEIMILGETKRMFLPLDLTS
jgi:transcriptional antiterminator NusG